MNEGVPFPVPAPVTGEGDGGRFSKHFNGFVLSRLTCIVKVLKIDRYLKGQANSFNHLDANWQTPELLYEAPNKYLLFSFLALKLNLVNPKARLCSIAFYVTIEPS